ncbi:single-stranded DNA-binding protein, partial [Solicola sp. PLA-1-18]|uniref:single-stranded DNA-binding protein n=1 Tax=Solicola sp. PLA-1-18 TaxID=3380532 RepID=UPI003B82716A
MALTDEQDEIPYANEVQIGGRVAALPVVKVMPSGDEMVAFRVIVRRPPAARRRSKITVDTIDCVAWTSTARRTAARLQAEDVVEVTGSLRRRFQRAGGGP